MKFYSIISFILIVTTSGAFAEDVPMGHVYNFTDGVQIYRGQKNLVLDHGLKILKGDMISLEPEAILYIENCTIKFNELMILAGKKTKGKIKIEDALKDSFAREKTETCLIQKEFIELSSDYLGINLRGPDFDSEFKAAERHLLNILDETSITYPVTMIKLLTLYLKHDKIDKAKAVSRKLRERHPDSGYLKAVDEYLLRVEHL